MMDSLQSRHITYLTEEVRRLITAGQVVRKPCDVVKELFENSLDAGAKNITVFIDEGGYRRIIVEDDGCGFHVDDQDLIARQSFSSKVKTLSDAHNITSFGFRGEALAAMATKGTLSVVSRRHEADTGIILEIKNGKRDVKYDKNLNAGTRITVSDVFRVPPSRDIHRMTSKIIETIKTYMILNVNYSITVHSNKTFFKTPEIKCSSVSEWLKHLYNTDFNSQSLDIDDNVVINLYYGYPEALKLKRNEFIYFVNKRLVILKDITTQLKGYIASVKDDPPYGLFIIDIQIPPSTVDVHVDPQKLNVCLRESSKIRDAILNYFRSNYIAYLEERKLIEPNINSSINLDQSLNSTSRIIQQSSTPRISIDPTQIVRADSNQRSMTNFVNLIHKQPSDSTTNTAEVMNKVNAFIPVIVAKPNDRYLIQGYHRIVLSSSECSENVYFPYVLNNGVRKILCHRMIRAVNEQESLYHEALIEPELLYNELPVIPKSNDDGSFDFKNARNIILSELQKTSQKFLDIIRNAANIKISLFNEEYHVFFQHQDSFNVVPFMNVLHEYLVQIFIENLGKLDEIGNADGCEYKYSDFAEDFGSRRYQSWDNIKTSGPFLLKSFSLRVLYKDNDVELLGVPHLQLDGCVSIPWDAYMHALTRIPCLKSSVANPVFIRQWIWTTANELAHSIVAHVGNSPIVINSWKDDVVRRVFKKYYPGKLFAQSLTHATTKDLFKIFERC